NARGLRIAFDVEDLVPTKPWDDLAVRSAWDLMSDDPDDERWALAMNAQLLESATAHIAKNALPASTSSRTYGEPRSHWDGNMIETRIAVTDSNIGEAGDVVITMEPSLDDKHRLAIKMCIDFDEDLGTAFRNLLETTFAGFVVGGIIG